MYNALGFSLHHYVVFVIVFVKAQFGDIAFMENDYHTDLLNNGPKSTEPRYIGFKRKRKRTDSVL